MSTFKEPFEVDQLRVDIDQIEKEKSTLEARCSEAINKRKLLEEKVENANIKFTQLSDKLTKMKETFRIAKFKAEQAESQSKLIEQKNEEIKNRISELKNKMEEEKEKRLKNLSAFEDQLYSITELFVNASSYYTETGLKEEKVRIEESKTTSEKKIEEINKELSKLSSELDALRAQPQGDIWSSELPLEQRKSALKLFQEENESARATMDKLIEEKSKLEKKYEMFKEAPEACHIDEK